MNKCQTLLAAIIFIASLNCNPNKIPTEFFFQEKYIRIEVEIIKTVKEINI